MEEKEFLKILNDTIFYINQTIENNKSITGIENAFNYVTTVSLNLLTDAVSALKEPYAFLDDFIAKAKAQTKEKQDANNTNH